jgi:hypothetical protein
MAVRSNPDRYKPEEKPTHCYVGRGPCGCVWSICTCETDKSTAQMVADMIKSGQVIDRLLFDEAHSAFLAGLKCDHKTVKDAKGPLL